MCSIQKIFILVFIMVLNDQAYSQVNTKLPMSIYASKTKFNAVFTEISINHDLNLIGHQFRFVDVEDIKSNLYSVSFNNMGRKATLFDFDSYQRVIFNETDKYFDPNKIAILPYSLK